MYFKMNGTCGIEVQTNVINWAQLQLHSAQKTMKL